MKLYPACSSVLLFAYLLIGNVASTVAQEQTTKNSRSTHLDSYQDWTHTGSVWLITNAEGANLQAAASLDGFPLLVRLHKEFFDFSQTQSQGEDLRFSSSTGEPLAYQIEDWDSVQGLASVWVRVPKIVGNAQQEIKLHWGNANAISQSDGKSVFNESNGYLSVWHMNEPVLDTTGTLICTDTGTSATAGIIGTARHFSNEKGIFGGDMIPNYPTESNAHSTEVWFRAQAPNSTIIGWGNEQAQGKVVMQFRSPPHIRMDCYFSGGDVSGGSKVGVGDWTQAVHTYRDGECKLYLNGVLDGTNLEQGSPLAIKSPAKLWLGGWYNHYDFVGDLDEVRVSQVVRSADWIKLQYENQKPNQTLVGSLVQPGSEFSVSNSRVTVKESQTATVNAKAGGALKVAWILKQGEQESVVATDRFSYTFNAGRVVGDQAATLTFKAIYADDVRTQDIAITIVEDVPEPVFTLSPPDNWDGRETIEIVPQITNLESMTAKDAEQLSFAWTVDDVAVIKQVVPGKLIIKRAQGSGKMKVAVAISNGGESVFQSATILVQESPLNKDLWVVRPPNAVEQPEDNQFFARDNNDSTGEREATLVYAGKLTTQADSVFVRVFADDQLFANEMGKLTTEGTYSLSVKLKAGLVKYRTEFGSKTNDRETVLHTASNLICGDAFLVIGQSNAVANDFGPENTLKPSDWVRTFGATDGGPEGSRLKLWANAQARSPGGKSEVGYWAMKLAQGLVEREKTPICIINGAVGGTRIDQHQRNDADPTDVTTIYGRLLWRAQQAKLTHGIRAVFWHQGENDQGADGPTGGYGYETYRQYFVDLSAAWKEDYPNIQHYYVFQIWPKACSMGIDGSDNKLRDVQRKLSSLYSNLSVMSTLGIKPPGGCHFPAAGYAEFARLISPLVEQHIYHRTVHEAITPPNLKRAFFNTNQRDELILEFDLPIIWSDDLTSQFSLDGNSTQVASGSASGSRIALKLKNRSTATKVTYLDSDSWSPDHLLYGDNGLAALTFCDVPIER